jgi:hypothetical protein
MTAEKHWRNAAPGKGNNRLLFWQQVTARKQAFTVG